MGKAVGDWFYDRSAFEKIDPPYPSNPTCVNVDSDSWWDSNYYNQILEPVPSIINKGTTL